VPGQYKVAQQQLLVVFSRTDTDTNTRSGRIQQNQGVRGFVFENAVLPLINESIREFTRDRPEVWNRRAD
jgi:hypothetical protein